MGNGSSTADETNVDNGGGEGLTPGTGTGSETQSSGGDNVGSSNSLKA
eukprot:CAMPEP_0113880508 /NCGR_PEP_ID=MMETSP0780_2-20120614/7826_1 /TAXON_ID=652834 /ORGANISM="Palpitomonas bilix" /LENGTH=47 /DNA_ID=CAMNT_0000867195 /DNA_START=90 /DNA_END=233 /DNA_ORIENTATION=- /assembly_acc=CAM_ASM_000599